VVAFHIHDPETCAHEGPSAQNKLFLCWRSRNIWCTHEDFTKVELALGRREVREFADAADLHELFEFCRACKAFPIVRLMQTQKESKEDNNTDFR
jgi:hypothetical protein